MAFAYFFEITFTEEQINLLKKINIHVEPKQIISHEESMRIEKTIGRVLNFIPNYIKDERTNTYIPNDRDMVIFSQELSNVRMYIYRTDNLAFQKLRREGRIDTSNIVKCA